jgi:Zn-dependent protease
MPFTIVLAKIVVFALGIMSIILHEVAHALVAFRLGDPTAAQQGRITLNPIKHIDPIFTILFPAVTFLASGGTIMFGGAKPVPINPYRFRNLRKGMMISAMAGPLTNMLIAVTCGVLLRLPFLADPLQFLFGTLGLLNVFLAVFNMIPVPPLDGSRLISYLLPREMAIQYEKLTPFGLPIVVLLVMSGATRHVFPIALKIMVFIGGDEWIHVLF